MRSAFIPADVVVADSTNVIATGDGADESLILPASRPAVDARGLALGVLAALAFVLSLWVFFRALLTWAAAAGMLHIVPYLETRRLPQVQRTGAEESDQSNGNQVESHDVVQELGRDQNQYAGNQRGDRGETQI